MNNNNNKNICKNRFLTLMLLTPFVDEIFASMELTHDWQVIPIIRTLIVSNIFAFFWLELLFPNSQTHGGWSKTLLVAYSGSAIISQSWDKLFGYRDLQEREQRS